jgi:toxin ParE1/3/4
VYYAAARPGVERRFWRELNDAIERITWMPELYPVGLGGLRKCVLKHFPYVIWYRDTEAEIYIVAIAHTSRRPGYWKERI